ncbi:MAG: hypothetical protein IPK07_06590 [Deltaproteobacteria bacterium]|jgi:hypothetical protein|nr:hypothetical protein [Deltaproteobacteria bacterium]
MAEHEGRDLIVFTDEFKLKGRVHMSESDDVIPTAGSDPYLDLFDCTIYDQTGATNVGRAKRVKLRRTAIVMYFFEEDFLGKVR